MPFITIELPKSVTFSLTPFAQDVHLYLSEFFATSIDKFKTKMVQLDEVYVGDGNPKNTYANIKVELMTGREKEKLVTAAQELLKRYKKAIQEQNPGICCRVTSEFYQIDRELLCAEVLE
ncbi:MAG: hypothetical protein LLF94_09090 [Chlamydiales bacterium]|nr:hypothetical protein [Chlamydiales bacterium]